MYQYQRIYIYRLKEENILHASIKLEANKVSIVDQNFIIKGWGNISKGYDFSHLMNLKEGLSGNSEIYFKGHHFKGIHYPIIIKDDSYSIEIESDYPDALLTIDQLPKGEDCFDKKK